MPRAWHPTLLASTGTRRKCNREQVSAGEERLGRHQDDPGAKESTSEPRKAHWVQSLVGGTQGQYPGSWSRLSAWASEVHQGHSEGTLEHCMLQ